MTKLPLTLVLTNTGISLHHTEGRKLILEFFIYTYLYDIYFFSLSAVLVKISNRGDSFAFAVILLKKKLNGSLCFTIYDKYKCYREHRKDEGSRIAYVEYRNFLAALV